MNRLRDYYRNTLPDMVQKSIYDRLSACLGACMTDIPLGHLPNPSFDMNNVLSAVMLDHPELFWVNFYRCTVSHSVLGTSAKFSFIYPCRAIPSMAAEADLWKRHTVSQIRPTAHRNEKIWMLYDYLARQVTYGGENAMESHTIAGVFRKHVHTAVCEGVAKAFKYLCDALQIPCIVAIGSADFGSDPQRSGHAWNIVRTEDGRFRHLDITTELQSARIAGHARTGGYLCTDSEMRGYHWDRSLLPVCI